MRVQMLVLVLISLMTLAAPVGAQKLESWELGGRSRFVEQLASGLEAKRTVVIGEVHGTNEAQQLVAEVIRKIAHEQTILLALELPEELQSGVDAYRASDGTTKDIQAFLANPFWQGFSDGRNSLRCCDSLSTAAR